MIEIVLQLIVLRKAVKIGVLELEQILNSCSLDGHHWCDAIKAEKRDLKKKTSKQISLFRSNSLLEGTEEEDHEQLYTLSLGMDPTHKL